MQTFTSRVLLGLALSICFPPAVAAQETADPIADAWEALLADHVRPGVVNGIRSNLVDYEALASDERWPKLVEALAVATPPEGRDAKLAFWLNAYNIAAVRVVLLSYPVDSINDVDSGLFESVWTMEVGKVAGEVRTLDGIEHGIVRPMGEPLVHAALVCAAASCPDLRREAYRADKLQEQLREQMNDFLTKTRKGARLENGYLYVSSIFDWFTEDFTTGERSLRDFLMLHLPDDLKSRIGDETEIAFMEYDWTLNDTKKGE